MKKPPALSTICISALLAGPIAAQAVPNGCYTRDYSTSHLAAHPEQIVDWITVLFRPSDVPGQTYARVQVQLADQGHAGRDGLGGLVMMQELSNFYAPDHFNVEGDGGSFNVTSVDTRGVTLQTNGVFLSAGGDFFEEPSSNLAEHSNGPTTYRLNTAPPGACR